MCSKIGAFSPFTLISLCHICAYSINLLLPVRAVELPSTGTAVAGWVNRVCKSFMICHTLHRCHLVPIYPGKQHACSFLATTCFIFTVSSLHFTLYDLDMITRPIKVRSVEKGTCCSLSEWFCETGLTSPGYNRRAVNWEMLQSL